MASAIRMYSHGGPEVLQLVDVEIAGPGPGEARIRHVAVGLNFADTYFRSGLYPAKLPTGLGVEASGVIEAVGPDVIDFSPGDRVTYTGSPLGAYSTERTMPTGLVGELFDHVASRRIDVEINQRYRLDDAAQAHRDLEARRTTGSSIFDLTF